MSLDAILVDLDGTIADSLPVLFDVYRRFLGQFGLEGTREEFSELNGPSIAQSITVLRDKYGLQEDADDLYRGYCKLFKDSYAGMLKPFPGTRDFLDFLRENEVALALVTSAPKLLARTFLDAQDLSSFFSVQVTADDVLNTKPHPEPYQRALSLLNVEPERAMVVEDSVQGLQSGLGAGIPTVMIQHRPDDQLPPPGVLAVVASWSQLRRLIESRVVYA